MTLAHDLAMTRRELLTTMDSYEMSMWVAYFHEKNQPKEQAPLKKETLVGQLKNAFMGRKKGKALKE